jgi:alkylation response protein AidB-like acyl-CoA dehydrogenase
MNLEQTEEQKQIVATVRRFVREEIVPLEAKLDPDASELPREDFERLTQKVREMGFWGLDIPAEYGGAGVDMVTRVLMAIEMSQHRAGLYVPCYGVFGAAGLAQLYEATEDQKQRYLHPMLRGEKRGFFGLTEPSGGSDPARAIRTRAVRDGDDFVVTGHKHYISASTFADVAITMCVTDPDAGSKGISALFVPLDAPGVRLEFDCVPMTGQFVDADILLDHVRVPARNLIGVEGDGFRIAMDRISVNRLLHCPTMIGLARQALRHSIDYAHKRQQFGGPISRFQAIQHMLADMATALYACEQMVLATAEKADRGEDIRTEASMCKLFVSERCFEIADKAVQIHGNVGVTRDHPVEFIFRRLRMYRIVTGTSEIQRNTVAKGILQAA